MIRHHQASARARREAAQIRRERHWIANCDIHITTENQFRGVRFGGDYSGVQAGVCWQLLEVGTHRRSAFVTLAALAAKETG